MLRTLFVFLFLWGALFASERYNSPSVSIFPSREFAAKEAARRIADLIASKKGQKTVLGLATGSTMIPVYQELKKILREESIDLSGVITFNLDEYLDLPSSHPQSYRSFMFFHFFEELLASPENRRGIERENIHFPSEDNRLQYEQLLNDLGPVDLQLLGIGRNGHIGFAEPNTPFDSETMIVELAPSTREDNAHFFDGDLSQMPRRAATMGIRSILRAKEIVLLAFGNGKADPIAKALSAPISTGIPATALRTHPHVSFLLDEEAASMLKTLKIHCFRNARILIDHKIQEGALWVANGKIIPPQPQADEEMDMGGKILAPGYIDLQINGGFGCDFSRNPESLPFVASQLLQFGVTAFLPTVISSNKEQYRSVLPRLYPRSFDQSGAAVLGIHLEGPFFASNCIGAHNPLFILSKGIALENIYDDLIGIKLVTLAPELPGMEDLIKDLKSRGIVVAAGHSAATLSQMRAAIEFGVGFSTHLFNAMCPYHHREAGIIGAALIDCSVPYSLILDGVHLSPETVLLCWKCNPDGLTLISDATEVLGLSDGNYKLGTMDIEVKADSVLLAGTNKIAGSRLSLDKAVQRLYQITHCSIAEALEAASLKPAQIIRAYPQKGTLSIGADADFIVLSDTLEVEKTYLGGKLAWEKSLRSCPETGRHLVQF